MYKLANPLGFASFLAAAIFSLAFVLVWSSYTFPPWQRAVCKALISFLFDSLRLQDRGLFLSRVLVEITEQLITVDPGSRPHTSGSDWFPALHSRLGQFILWYLTVCDDMTMVTAFPPPSSTDLRCRRDQLHSRQNNYMSLCRPCTSCK